MKHDKQYMQMAKVWATNSYANRLKVGAIIVNNGMIISDGYNGTISGFKNVCEDSNNKTYPHVLHAEANAITKLCKSNSSSQGGTIYVTHAPCIHCAKLIIQSGITRVVFGQEYKNKEGLVLLMQAKINIEQVVC